VPGRTLALATAVALIVMATLAPRRPATGWESGRFDVCLFCGTNGGLDAVNNVLLFLPFGAAGAAVGWRLSRTIGTATALATVVELIQLIVLTGRYAGLGDILFNTAGALAGAALFRTHPILISPSPRAARIGAILAAAAASGIAAATAWLLGLPVPDQPLFGQWAPGRAVMFTGELHRASLNGGPLHDGPIDAQMADSFRALAATRRASIEADITPAAPPPGVVPIVRLVTDDLVLLAISQSRDAIVFVPALRSRLLGLRTIAIEVPAEARPSERLHIQGSAEPRMLHISADGSGGRSSRRLKLTVGLGWTMLLPFTIRLSDAPAMGSFLWLAVLALPIGFYAVAARSSGRSSLWWVIIPAGLVVAFAFIPAVAGIAASEWTEWVGAVSGAALGAVAGQRVRRARIVHGAKVLLRYPERNPAEPSQTPQSSTARSD
jgi:hypothetical protein